VKNGMKPNQWHSARAHKLASTLASTFEANCKQVAQIKLFKHDKFFVINRTKT